MLSTYDLHRRLHTWEVRRLCAICNLPFITCVQATRGTTCEDCEPEEADFISGAPAAVAKERANMSFADDEHDLFHDNGYVEGCTDCDNQEREDEQEKLDACLQELADNRLDAMVKGPRTPAGRLRYLQPTKSKLY
jgi:Zn-finger protein